jgi:predicted nucleotidyltransferase
MARAKRQLPPVEAIAAVQRFLNRLNNQGVVIGGIAVSMYVEPRSTADVDAMLVMDIDQLKTVIREAKAEKIVVRYNDSEQFARERRVLLLVHEPTSVEVDISFGALPLEYEMLERSIYKPIGAIQLRVPTLEDLIIQKAIAHRPKDMIDVKALIDSSPDLDKRRIKKWVKEFADFLEMPELWEDIAKWL